MSNMPGFEEACQLYHDSRLHKKIGFHLVLSEGIPLTDNIKKCDRICDATGQFRRHSRPHLFLLGTSNEKKAVYEEISAQIARCTKHGIQLTHIDSHEHVHVEWAIATVLLRVAKENNIRYIRKSRSIDPNSSWIKNLYRRSFNLRLAIGGHTCVDNFGTVDDYLRIKQNRDGKVTMESFEIMIHPTFGDNTLLIDSTSNYPLQEYLSQVDNYDRAVSYGYFIDRPEEN